MMHAWGLQCMHQTTIWGHECAPTAPSTPPTLEQANANQTKKVFPVTPTAVTGKRMILWRETDLLAPGCSRVGGSTWISSNHFPVTPGGVTGKRFRSFCIGLLQGRRRGGGRWSAFVAPNPPLMHALQSPGMHGCMIIYYSNA